MSQQQRVEEFLNTLNSGEDAEALDQFFTFEIGEATLRMYAELEDILAGMHVVVVAVH